MNGTLFALLPGATCLVTNHTQSLCLISAAQLLSLVGAGAVSVHTLLSRLIFVY